MNYKTEIAALIAEHIGLGGDELSALVEVPPNSDLGDFAFPCFSLAKELKKSPAAIAADLAGKIGAGGWLQSVAPTGAYLNFFVDKTAYASEILSRITREGAEYGHSGDGGGKTVVIDFSSPNIAKPFHVGHLRSTVIGAAIYNLHKARGYKVVGINHLGDWGTQFGKLSVAYSEWGDKEAVLAGGIQELNRLYVKFHEEAEKDPTLEDRAREFFVRMQRGDEDALAVWKWFYDLSLEEFKKIYERLNVGFDAWTGESFYNDKMDAVVKELREKGLLTSSDGAMIVDLAADKMPPCLILRRDGGTLYPTRDLAAAFYRKNTYHFDKAIYITAQDQALHFAQWFKVIEKMGYPWANELLFVPFGLIAFEEGKISTRAGRVIWMDELLNEAVDKALEKIEEKSPGRENKQEVARQVGISAVKFNDMYNNRIKDVTFSWERMLNFDGETGPFVQYSHARSCSVLAKADETDLSGADFSLITDAASMKVIKLLAAYPDKIKESCDKCEPYLVSRQLVDIAQAFNGFYAENRILNGTTEEVKKARLLLTRCVKITLAAGLEVLGLDAPERM